MVMDESWTLSAPRRAGASTSSRRPPDESYGQHGWDNSLPSMRAMFLITGPGIREGALIDEVQNVDVYPLMTELLGLRPARDLDGRAGVIRDLIMK